MKSIGCVTGRFQPVHEQHLDLFRIALRECGQLIIALTNPDTGTFHEEAASTHRHTSLANPFTYFERVMLLEAALRDTGIFQKVVMVPFDLKRPDVWTQYVPLCAQHYVRVYSDWERQKAEWLTQAGYRVKVFAGSVRSKLSASDIRAAIRSGSDHWNAYVPHGTAELIEEFLRLKPIGARL